ncbi:K02A2.6-like [Cordylochernes scorpioides]|uniref:RNA-directed DNA polymerase n=1 Tax=Cordylochernes scorpioides TaxID=51811 RepID=A0ABY6L880_9ARAC|nr:K02A2.6-like [Cordylochernes scorpioides]
MAISQTVPFRIYDPKEDDFEIFIQRFNAACTANETSEHKKVVILLSLLDSGLLKLGNDLFFPEKMEAQTYELIVKKIRQYLEPKKKIIPQRCLFLKRTQRENESVSEYLRELKHLASNCSFGEMLEMMLRDRFVAGLTSESLQKRLLQEDDEVKLERVFALAVSYELAEKDAKELHEKEVARVTSHIERNRKSKYSPTKENFASATKERTCYRCGMKNSHLAPACPQKFKTCYKCKKIGHLSNVCKARGNTQKSGYVQQQNIFSLRGGTEVEIALTVDGQILNGSVDTGSPVTLLPKSIFEKLWRAKPLIPTAINLGSFCNNPIKVVGERKVFVKEANMSLRLIVVDESIPEILLGREWLKFLNINYSKLLNVNKISESCIDSLIESYANLFKDELGCLKDVKLDISIKKEEAPVFCKARSLPYSLKKKVENELECMVERGILEPIVHASWAAPIVPVVKKNGSIRICGDFRSTANKAIILDKYPLPTIDEIFSRLSGSTNFSTLDLSMAYLQVELTDEAKRVVNINTTKGLFAYRRLPYGVAVAPNKFQRLMDNVFADIPGVACYIDDILVSGKDARDHKSKLELVFKRLEEKGLNLNKAKCKFAVDSVEYLGFRIDKNGLHPMLNKIQAVSNAPEPKNIGQLRSFIGMLMYYARFIKDTSSILSPFYQLLKKNCPWKWTNKHRVLFNKCKSLLTDELVLAHYDPAKELVLACDASSYGLGVVLSHRYKKQESPIAFASRTLTEAEKHYSQLEKEALSIVYGCEKFRQYLLGRSFVLVTDNRPLMHLFSPHKPIPLCAASRIKRWSLKLGAFHYSVEFRKMEDHGNADALSRLPLKANEGGSYDDDQILLLRKMNEVPFSFQDVAFETKRDKTLAIVLRNVREDTWQSPKFTKENPLSPYYKVRNELSVDFGCLQWKERIMIPPKLRSQILIDLHEMHFGMVKMKIIARRYFWWPGIDRSIEDMARQCTICQESADMPPSMITEWTWPEKPWHRLHLDLAGPFMGKMFLVIVDAYTKWLEIFILRDITSKTIVDCLRQVFARFGLPEFLVTDNGRQFVSREMEEFTRMNRIRHTKTSPYNPSTNGLAERYVREFKTSLKKNNEKDDLETNLQRFLFAHRAFPQSVLKESPAELLMKRRLKSRFSNLMPKIDMKGEGFPDALRKQEHFKIGSNVYFRNYAAGPKWKIGTILKLLSCRHYLIGYEGQSLKRHINQLRPVKRNPEATVEKEPSLVLPSTSGQELRRESHCEREPSHGGLEIPEEEVTTNELEPQSTRQEGLHNNKKTESQDLKTINKSDYAENKDDKYNKGKDHDGNEAKNIDEEHCTESKNLEEEKNLDVKQGMDFKSTEEVKQIDAEQGTDSKVAEEKLDAEQGFIEGVNGNPPEVKGHYLPRRLLFKSESKTTPIRPVFDDAFCRGHNGLSLKRYSKKIPNLLQRIPEIRKKIRENKFGILVDMRRYFGMIAIKENDRDYLRFLWKKRMDAYGAISGLEELYKPYVTESDRSHIMNVLRERKRTGSMTRGRTRSRVAMLPGWTGSKEIEDPVVSPKGRVDGVENHLVGQYDQHRWISDRSLSVARAWRTKRFKKARMIKSKLKCPFITFFDVKGLVHYEFVPEDQTINQHYSLDVLRRLREAVRQKRPEKWHKKNLLLHHDSARPHTAGTKKGCIQAPRITTNSSRPRATLRSNRVHECQTTRHPKQATFEKDFIQEQYFRALEAKLGKDTVYQLTKIERHIQVGLSSVQLADKLIDEGLDIEDATLRAFPLRKRAERIVLGNVPFFVEDADLVAALRPYGQVTSIIQKMMQLEDSCWADARREAFITLIRRLAWPLRKDDTQNREAFHTLIDSIKLSQIPARLDIKYKGVVTHVYVTYGIKYSLCLKQGHKRANCPRKTGVQEVMLVLPVDASAARTQG